MHKPYSAVRRRNKVVIVYVNSETGSERWIFIHELIVDAVNVAAIKNPLMQNLDVSLLHFNYSFLSPRRAALPALITYQMQLF